MERLALVKAKFWEYENEFRVMATNGADWGAELEGEYVRFEPEVLTGITIGMRMGNDQREQLLEMINELRPGLPVWEVKEDHDRFWTRINQLQ